MTKNTKKQEEVSTMLCYVLKPFSVEGTKLDVGDIIRVPLDNKPEADIELLIQSQRRSIFLRVPAYLLVDWGNGEYITDGEPEFESKIRQSTKEY